MSEKTKTIIIFVLSGVILCLAVCILFLSIMIGKNGLKAEEVQGEDISTATVETEETTAPSETESATEQTTAPEETETTEETTTEAVPELTLPETAYYVDPDSREKVYGNLTGTYSLDIDQDGRTELIGKYYSSSNYSQDYFYQVYRDETMLFSTYIDGGRGCGTGYDFILYDGIKGVYKVARMYFEDGYITVFAWRNNGDLSTYMVYPYPEVWSDNGFYDNSEVCMIPGGSQDVHDCYNYVKKAKAYDNDKRDLSSKLIFDLPAEVPPTEDAAALRQQKIDEINEYYSGMIRSMENEINSLKSSSSYDPSYAGMDSSYYDALAAEAMQRKSQYEQNGDMASAEAAAAEAEEYTRIATLIDSTSQIQIEIDAYYDEIRILEADWDAALAAVK